MVVRLRVLARMNALKDEKGMVERCAMPGEREAVGRGRISLIEPAESVQLGCVRLSILVERQAYLKEWWHDVQMCPLGAQFL